VDLVVAPTGTRNGWCSRRLALAGPADSTTAVQRQPTRRAGWKPATGARKPTLEAGGAGRPPTGGQAGWTRPKRRFEFQARSSRLRREPVTVGPSVPRDSASDSLALADRSVPRRRHVLTGTALAGHSTVLRWEVVLRLPPRVE